MGMTKEEESGPWIPRQEVKRKGVKVNPAVMQELLRPHIDSYDYFVQRGLATAILAIQPIEVEDSVSGTKLRIFLENPSISSPLKDSKDKVDHRLFPDQCRQAGLSYRGHFSIDICVQYNDSAVCSRENTSFGKFPIMVKSSICNLRGLSPQQLIQHNEEPREMGGYFICNGIERIIRMLILPKRNHPIALKRPSFQNRGAGFTDKAIVMRCVRQDQTASTIRLYYLQNGNAVLGFTFRRQEFILPVGLILKALIDTSDREIYDQLRVICKEGREHTKGAVGSKVVDTKGVVGSQVVDQRARIILEDVHRFNLFTRLECLQFIGETFRTHLGASKNLASITIGEMVLSSNILVHLHNPRDKFNLLIHMLHKLFALVDGTAAVDNSDTLQYQEALLPGHLLNIYVKDRLEDWLQKLKIQLSKDISSKTGKFDLQNVNCVKETLKKVNAADISRRVEYLLSTGNLQSNSFLDLQQNTGFTVVAEKLNFLRYFSHFRSIHRGLYFARQRTTTVRKLLPESWGFLCPVHTPDGEPCGLLCHLSSQCSISTDLDHRGKVKDFLLIRKKITALLMEHGMITAVSSLASVAPPDYLCVLLDGCIIGYIPTCLIPRIISFLRREKVDPTSEVPADLEVAYIPCTYAGAYPGLFLFTTPARLLRPVKQLQSSDGVDWSHREDFPSELISPFEQAYMEIVCPDGKDGGRAGASASAPATHSEIHPTAMLSVVASLTPWSDHNQSPRNMYQCQMGKQTMGIPGQALQFRYDHKLYRLQTPQSPVAQTAGYRKFHMDDYPTGTNAVVAVLAYTGYDMEDAMIINKSSMERGLCHGQIIKTETIDLEKLRRKGDSIVNVFGREAKGLKSLDIDGMPYIGQPLQDGDVFCTSLNTMNQKAKHHKLKAAEPVVVDTVAAIGTGGILQKVNIRMRHGRNPVIGDKFSSRHGQKGVLSQLWPDINMPFSAVTGMRPDIIINPHAFPSRMTIGMLLESMAAKAGTLEGRFVDSTPFQRSGSNMGKNSNKPPNDSYRSRFGESLVAHGFNYHGTEVMYSGILGTEMACEIYFGVVYYQRLRHMVSDKFQVRSTGTVNPVTKQPVGGRKAGGGIRFGEMERDSLLAHGAAYLLHDRLHACSDYHIADVCSLCGSLLAPLRSNEYEIGSNTHLTTPGLVTKATCRWCETGKGIVRVAMPFVFRYLAAELTAMNVKLTLTVLPSH